MTAHLWTFECAAHKQNCMDYSSLSGRTSGSPAAEWQRSGWQGCVWHGSASPERCTPPSQSRGCGPTGRSGASLLAAADWLLQHIGNIPSTVSAVILSVVPGSYC